VDPKSNVNKALEVVKIERAGKIYTNYYLPRPVVGDLETGGNFGTTKGLNYRGWKMSAFYDLGVGSMKKE